MGKIKNIPAWQFTCFRILFGAYLVVHFLQLPPYAGELFSGTGLLADHNLNLISGVLPNPLEHFRSATFATSFVALLAVLAVLFTAGVWRRTTALLLWFGWACLFNRNNLILNPGLPYVGLLLLLCALIPPGEPLSFQRRRVAEVWRMPAMIFWSAWFLLAAGYTYSGCGKLLSPSWIDGSALWHLANNPLARPGLMRDLLLSLPEDILKVLTWGALIGEVLVLPLSLFKRGRLIGWTWMLTMHLGILLVVDFADLTLGMVMIHLFTFDPDWLPARKRAGQTLLLFDGDCALCHGTVQFFVREDRLGTLKFAPLQGPTAAPILKRHGSSLHKLRSMILVERAGSPEERVFLKSTAALRALSYLGGFWRMIGWGQIIPEAMRNIAYDWVAQNRYRWFGRAPASCPLPSAGVMRRILE